MDLLPNKSDAVLLPITNTRISASEWNQLVGSCMAFIYAAGFSPDAADNEQFLNAFKKIASELELVGANTALSNLTSAGDIYGSKLGMPSSTFTDLTIGASGATYTAQANGWVLVFASGTNGRMYVENTANSMVFLEQANSIMRAYIPIKVGQNFRVVYSGDVSVSTIRFIYAEGSKTEAN